MDYDVISCGINMSDNVEYLDVKKGVTKILPKRFHCHYKRSCNAIKKMLDKFSFDGHLTV